jgi:hypothetical protein
MASRVSGAGVRTTTYRMLTLSAGSAEKVTCRTTRL